MARIQLLSHLPDSACGERENTEEQAGRSWAKISGFCSCSFSRRFHVLGLIRRVLIGLCQSWSIYKVAVVFSRMSLDESMEWVKEKYFSEPRGVGVGKPLVPPLRKGLFFRGRAGTFVGGKQGWAPRVQKESRWKELREKAEGRVQTGSFPYVDLPTSSPWNQRVPLWERILRRETEVGPGSAWGWHRVNTEATCCD